MNRVDTQDHHLVPSFEKYSRDNVAPNFLPLSFVPPVASSAPPPDLVAIKQTFFDLPDPSSLPCRLITCHSPREAWMPDL